MVILGRLRILLSVAAVITGCVILVWNPQRAIELLLLLTVAVWTSLAVVRYPNTYVFLLILAITNIFGIFNILEEWRIPGIGKPSDFILVFMNVMVLAFFLMRRAELTRAEKRFSRLALAIIGYVIFLVFYSAMQGYESLDYALRIGGTYLYYSAFFFPIFLITERRQLVHFINFLRLAGFITGLITIISNVVGHSVVTATLSAETEGYVRVYLPYFFNFFVVGLWTAQFMTRYEGEARVHFWEMIVNALGQILFLGRGQIVGLILVGLLSWMVVPRATQKGKRALWAATAVSVGLVLAFAGFGFDSTGIANRFRHGILQTMQGTGTFNGRLQAEFHGVQAFLRSPLFGTGFVYPTSPIYSSLITTSGTAATNSSDFGLGSILFTTGIIGFGLITYFVFSIISHIRRELREREPINGDRLVYVYSMTILVIIPVLFIVVQLISNEFGGRSAAVDAIALAYSVRFLEAESTSRKLQGANP